MEFLGQGQLGKRSPNGGRGGGKRRVLHGPLQMGPFARHRREEKKGNSTGNARTGGDEGWRFIKKKQKEEENTKGTKPWSGKAKPKVGEKRRRRQAILANSTNI